MFSYKEILDNYIVTKPERPRLDDKSISTLFANLLKDTFRYNTTAKSWYMYDGKRWKEDTEDMQIRQALKKFVDVLCEYYSVTCKPDDSYLDELQKLFSKTKRDTIIKDARDCYCFSEEDMDADISLFNCQNCVIKFNRNSELGYEILEHNPNFLLSKISNVTYDPDANPDTWQTFISEIMQNDIEKANYLQKAVGYSLCGYNAEERSFLLYGPSSRNGKSTFLETISYALGNYAMIMSCDTLSQKNRNPKQASGDIARLKNVRFLRMSEPEEKMVFDAKTLKALTGRDTIVARNLFQREFEFIPIFVLFINTNHLPIVTDDTLFTSDRLSVITFDKHFREEERNTQLKDILKLEENISAVFNWCLQGLTNYYHEGLQPPQSVVNATNDYKDSSDKIGLFFDDCLIKDSHHTLSFKVVFEEYQKWCEECKYGVENKSNLKKKLESKGLLSATGTISGKTVKNVIKGYRIRSEYDGDAISDDTSDGFVPYNEHEFNNLNFR